jgi:hypothetical protein
VSGRRVADSRLLGLRRLSRESSLARNRPVLGVRGKRGITPGTRLELAGH